MPGQLVCRFGASLVRLAFSTLGLLVVLYWTCPRIADLASRFPAIQESHQWYVALLLLPPPPLPLPLLFLLSPIRSDQFQLGGVPVPSVGKPANFIVLGVWTKLDAFAGLRDS